MAVVGHVCAPWLLNRSIPCRAPSAKREPYSDAPLIPGCHFATYFSDVEHIQAWLSSKGTP
jgi:hypothetical protein